MSQLPSVSIIIPTYNAAATLAACLDSVVAQTYPNKEIIVVDGKSKDDTVRIVQRYGTAVRWVSEPDEGIYDAMNKGIALATGDWLYFLGSDDTLHAPAILAEIFHQQVLPYDVIYGNALFKLARKKYDGKFSSLKLLRKNICHQAMFTRKEVFGRLGKFNTRYKALADYVFNMQWFHDPAIRKLYVDKVIAVYNEDGYCFNNPDQAFAADKQRLIDQYFPAYSRWLYRHSSNRLVNYLLKKA